MDNISLLNMIGSSCGSRMECHYWNLLFIVPLYDILFDRVRNAISDVLHIEEYTFKHFFYYNDTKHKIHRNIYHHSFFKLNVYSNIKLNWAKIRRSGIYFNIRRCIIIHWTAIIINMDKILISTFINFDIFFFY